MVRDFVNQTLLILVALVLLPCACSFAQDISKETHHRRPVALCFVESESFVAIANHESGTISLIALDGYQVVGEYKVAENCSDLVAINSDKMLVVSDSSTGLVQGLSIMPGETKPVKVRWQFEAGSNPVAMKLSIDEAQLAISDKWSRRIELIARPDNGWMERPVAKKTVDLPFNPGPLCWISKSTLVVADAFGSGIAVATLSDGKVAVVVSEMKGHRTGGLSLSADGKWIAFTDQRLNPLARSTRNDVHWGLMVSNQLRWLRTEELSTVLKASELKKLLSDFVNYPVGRTGDAKADLGDIAISPTGAVVFAVEGVDEVAIGNRTENTFGFAAVGRRPGAVACTDDGQFAFVANMLDDSISVVNLGDYETTTTISLGPRPKLDDVRLGERLFFDASLSHDNWMSCHSCHVEGHTNGALNDNFSDDSFRSPKLVISLLGHGDTLPLTWNGLHADFETQMRRSIVSTMQSDDPPTDEQIEQLTAFTRALVRPPSVSVSRKTVSDEKRDRGEALFGSLECVRCHAPPSFTIPELYEVGVVDEDGKTRFNPPSLIGLGQRRRFFHDGRYNSIQEVLVDGEHQLPRELVEGELSDLVEFLKSL